MAWQNSGMSKLAFCKERRLGYHTFVKDCKRFAAELGVGFSRVELPATSTTRERIEIHEQDGRRVFIPLDAPEGIIRMFLKGYARIKLDIPDHVDPQFRFMLTPCSGDVDPLCGVFWVG